MKQAILIRVLQANREREINLLHMIVGPGKSEICRASRIAENSGTADVAVLNLKTAVQASRWESQAGYLLCCSLKAECLLLWVPQF